LSKIKGDEKTAKTDDRLELNSFGVLKSKAKIGIYFNFKINGYWFRKK
jgi:hypothetical protein